jgi:putative transposase
MVMEKIETYRIRDKAAIHAYVVMPNHFHLLISIPEGKSISAYMRDLKKMIAYEHCRMDEVPITRFWQHRFDDFDIVTEKTYFTKLNYIHQNPVKAGLAIEPDKWEYSSAGLYMCGRRGIVTVTPGQ